LTIDHLSGFARDFYQREYRLDRFNICGDYIEPSASFASNWGRVRRRMRVSANRRRDFADKTYVVERDRRFNPDMLELKVDRPIYLQGYWQDERYFEDIRNVLCEELTIRTPHDPQNVEVARKIGSVESICLHVRRLHGVPNRRDARPLANASQIYASYPKSASEARAQKSARAHFFFFGDYPEWALEHVRTKHPIEFVAHNGTSRDYEDFWLMAQCRHYIIANSTFSWWAAWLGSHRGKIVIAPKQAIGKALG